MARLGFATPWAWDALAPHRDEITAGPEVVLDVGYAHGWTARLLDGNGRVLAEAFGAGSAIGAYREALGMLPETVRWRDTDVVLG